MQNVRSFLNPFLVVPVLLYGAFVLFAYVRGDPGGYTTYSILYIGPLFLIFGISFLFGIYRGFKTITKRPLFWTVIVIIGLQILSVASGLASNLISNLL